MVFMQGDDPSPLTPGRNDMHAERLSERLQPVPEEYRKSPYWTGDPSVRGVNVNIGDDGPPPTYVEVNWSGMNVPWYFTEEASEYVTGIVGVEPELEVVWGE